MIARAAGDWFVTATNIVYYEKRAAQEDVLAGAATKASVAATHRDFASAYRSAVHDLRAGLSHKATEQGDGAKRSRSRPQMNT